MTLPASGDISLQMVNIELAKSATALITLDDTTVRTLFGVSSGQISMSNGYGKSSAPAYTYDAGSIIFTDSGIYNFYVPNNVISMEAVAIGAGGGGGRCGPGSNPQGGQGGGGGALSWITNYSISPKTLITIGVGLQGYTTFTPQGSGMAGGDSFIQIAGANVILAKGGAGGTYGVMSLGGQASQGIGDNKYSGGNSLVPSVLNYGAGGGGAAGYAGNGGNSAITTSTNGSPGSGGGGGGGSLGQSGLEVQGGGEGGSVCARTGLILSGSFNSGLGGNGTGATVQDRKGSPGSASTTNLLDNTNGNSVVDTLHGGAGGGGSSYLPSQFSDSGQSAGHKGIVRINLAKMPSSGITGTQLISRTYSEVTTGTPIVTLPASTQLGDLIFLQLVSRKTTSPALVGTTQNDFEQLTTLTSSSSTLGYYRAEAFQKRAELTDIGASYSGMTVSGTATSIIVAWVIRTNTGTGRLMQRSVLTPTSSAGAISLSRSISTPYDVLIHGFPVFTAISYSTGASTRSTNRDTDPNSVQLTTTSGRFTLMSYNPTTSSNTSTIFSMTDGGTANYMFALAAAA